eukprot:jgi/Mesvir1/1626/Mv05063-RA.1
MDAARRKLPSYMVPSAVVALERFPVTVSGKVDARALPPVDLSSSGSRQYVAPRNVYEARVQAVCQDVLGVASLSVLASFHEFGINSLMAIALVHQMRERLAEFPGAGEGLRVTTVLANPSVAELAAVMACGRQVTWEHAVELRMQSFCGDMATGMLPPVSYGQEQMLALHELDPTSPAYNMGLWWHVVGHVDVDILRQSMQEVVGRHEALRTHYAMPALQAASQRGDHSSALMVNMHHSVSDGLSTVLLMRELCHIYSSIVKGVEACLPPLPVQYSDYAVWQRRWLEDSGEMAAQLAYWKGLLSDAPLLLELPTDKPRPRVQSLKGDCLAFTLERGVVKALKKLAQECGATLFMVMLTLWAALLGRCSRQDKHVRDVVLSAMEHSDAPFHKVVEAVGSMVVPYEVAGMSELALGPSARIMRNQSVYRHSSSKVDVSLVLFDEAQTGNLALLLEYRTDLWCEASMQRLGQQLVCLASSAVASPDTPVGRLPMMTEAERRQVVEDWNATDTAFACAGKCLHELFDEQDAGTVVGGRVGLCMKGCAEMVVGMLAILKAGCAYVPLDPEYPAERVQGMVADADISLLLTSPCQQPPWGADMHANVTLLEVPATSCCVSSPGLPVTRPAASFRVSPADLAYVIFTSGTTGRPKGVMVEHRSACNLVACVIDRWQLDGSSRVLQLTSPSFDMSVSEIFGTLCCGGALVTCRPHDNLHERLHLASFARFTPSLLATLDPTNFPRLAALVSGGEPLPLDLMRRWAAGRRLYNSYGPTECTGSATMEPMDASDDIIAIGRPLPNVRIYVLDRCLQPVPVGVPGELCIGGMGVARGYIKQPELTRERFLDNPLGAGRLYRTGDLARWLPDGRLECLGRLDRQVKLHGFRIELGEVESILEACPGVAKAVAILQDMAGHTDAHVTTSKLLVAYVVPASVQVDALMDAARRKLPSYMVPSAVVALERFPVTVSGKVDARALPPVDLSSSGGRQYVAPRNVYEARVQAVCQDVLGVASLSVLASFHEFGINSLMAMALVHQMRERLAEFPGAGEGLRVTTVLANPSVAELAAVMACGRQVTWEHAVELRMQSLRGDMATGMLPPVSYGQEQMLALHELDPTSPAYNMGLWWSVVGRVDVVILRRSMQEVVGRHEALRTHYAMPALQAASQGVPVAVQVVVPPDDFVLPFEVVDAGDDDQVMRAALHREASTPFDPYTGPLVRCLLAQRGDHSSALMVNMHHSTGNLTLLLEYRTDLWCEASMQRLGQQLVCLASSAVASPETPVGRLPMMTEAERAQLVESSQLTRWLQTPPSPLTLCDLWDCQVATRPADTAARCQEAALSFAELEDAAVMVSAVLAASGVGAEARVAIVMERSLLMLAAMLGVLKAGACYVSLDPANPPAYLASLLAVASVKALLWDHAVAGRLQGMVGLEQTACFIVDNLVADARRLPPSGLPQHPPIGRLTPSSTDAADGKTSRSSLLLYRTGDLARLLPCGDLALMGRLDHQVKVRGVRLELGFVEQAMARLPGVAAAGAVLVPATQQGLADAAGHDTLVAVVSPRGHVPEALLAALRQQLPLYALPRASCAWTSCHASSAASSTAASCWPWRQRRWRRCDAWEQQLSVFSHRTISSMAAEAAATLGRTAGMNASEHDRASRGANAATSLSSSNAEPATSGRSMQGGVLGLSILSGMGAAAGSARPSLRTPLLAVMLALVMEFGVSRTFDDLVRSSPQEHFSTTAHLWGLWALAFNQLLLWLCVGTWHSNTHRVPSRTRNGGVVLLLLAAATVQFLLPILFALLWPPASAVGVRGMWFGPWGMHQLGWEPLGPRVLTSAMPFAIGYAYNSQITRLVHLARSHVWLRVALAAIFVQLTVRSTFFPGILSGLDLRSSEAARFATVADLMATWEIGAWWREWPLRVLGHVGALAEAMVMAFAMLAIMPALDGTVTRLGGASLPIYLFHPHVLRLMEPFSFWLLRQVSSNMPLTVMLEVLLPLISTLGLCLVFAAMQRSGLGIGKAVVGLSLVLHLLKWALF